MKICRECGIEKADSEYTPPRLKCKVCVSARKTAWAEKNREHVLQQKRDWNAANAERVAERDRIRYAENGEAIRARRREVYYADPEKAIENSRRWQQRNASHRANYMRAYRAALRGIPSEPYTTEQVYAKTSGCCGICWTALRFDDHGRDGWHVDHIIPLVAGAEGGCTDTLRNVQPACMLCNLKKGATMPDTLEAVGA